jgi:hypothetical protein
MLDQTQAKGEFISWTPVVLFDSERRKKQHWRCGWNPAGCEEKT